MKKIILTATAVIAMCGVISATNVNDNPPYEGQKCNNGGSNGRLFYHKSATNSEKSKEGEANAGFRAIGAKGSAGSSTEQKESYSGYKCHTDDGRQTENWNDGHSTRTTYKKN